jgi:uncharacterized protein DUF4272
MSPPSQDDVRARCEELRGELRYALAALPAAESDPEIVDAIWRGEALGTLLWALGLVELPPYDEPFDHEHLVDAPLHEATLRDAEEIRQEQESARLWHWRARTTVLEREGGVELPAPWSSFEQLIAATAARGHEEGRLPAPLGDDFPAFGRSYRDLAAAEHEEAWSIALERQHALDWLCGQGPHWQDVPLDT